jgi:hypothetical protein
MICGVIPIDAERIGAMLFALTVKRMQGLDGGGIKMHFF